MTVLMNPDCMDAKHRACSGDGWCEATDQVAPCPCDCHQPAEHYAGCPCGACQGVRAAQPDKPVPLAYHPCCGATVTLTPRPGGYDAEPKPHLTSCPDRVATFLPKEG